MGRKISEAGCQCLVPVEDRGTYRRCGVETKGTFAPGHDARMKSTLQHLFRDKIDAIDIEGEGTRSIRDLAAERGWEKFLTEKAQAPKRERTSQGGRRKRHPADAIGNLVEFKYRNKPVESQVFNRRWSDKIGQWEVEVEVNGKKTWKAAGDCKITSPVETSDRPDINFNSKKPSDADKAA